MNRCRLLLKAWPSALLICLVGCSSMINEEFGAVRSGAKKSINGLGAHMRMWQQAGAKCLTPVGLSNRLSRCEVIVLVPQSFSPPGKQAREWLENWISEQPGRTVIYFGRDFNAQRLYFDELISKSNSAEERDLLEVERAKVKTSELSERLDLIQENTFCGWFYLDINQPEQMVEPTKGTWAESSTGESTDPWLLRTRLRPPKIEQLKAVPSWISKPAVTTQPTPPTIAKLPPKTNKKNVATSDDEEKLIFRSEWTKEEIASTEAWNSAFENLPATKILLQSSDGQPLIYKLTNRKRFGKGQIIVVANGSPFLNGSLVKPSFANQSAKLIKECGDVSRVALLTFGERGIQISNVDEMDSKGLGLEMLVQWPISAVTIPGCILGMVICIWLMPILGRPQKLPQASTSDFGLHVEALGELLQRTGDIQYARKAVADYFRTVRCESPPSWITQDSQREPTKPQQTS